MDATWVDRVDAEVDNVRGALDFADATGQSQRVLSATASLRDFWFTRGYITGGRTRLEDALAADAEPTSARCFALLAATAQLSWARRCAGSAGGTSTRRWSLADALGGPILERARDACRKRGCSPRTSDGRRRSRSSTRSSPSSATSAPGMSRSPPTGRVRGCTRSSGTWTGSWLLTEENLEHSRAHGHRRIEARSLGALYDIAEREGRYDEARDLLVQSYRIDRELGNVPFLSLNLGRFAVIHTRDGNLEVAVRLLACCLAVFDQIGFAPESWMTREIDEATEAVRARLDPPSSPRPGKGARG